MTPMACAWARASAQVKTMSPFRDPLRLAGKMHIERWDPADEKTTRACYDVMCAVREADDPVEPPQSYGLFSMYLHNGFEISPGEVWRAADDIEITLEANPNSVEVARFADLAAAGVNRATGETRYMASFKGLNPTTYTLTVVAVDEDGIQTLSRPSKVRVSAASPVRLAAEQREGAAGSPPEVVITARRVVGDSVQDDPLERRVRVVFYADGKPVGTSEMDGFVGYARFVWSGAQPGAHELTAIATNGDGASSDPSPSLRITVKQK